MNAPEAIRVLAAAYERGDDAAATATTRALPVTAHAAAQQLWRELDVARARLILYTEVWRLVDAAAGMAAMLAEAGELAKMMATDFDSVTETECDTAAREDYRHTFESMSDTLALVGSSWAERRERETTEMAADLAGLAAHFQEHYGVTDIVRTVEGASGRAADCPPELTPERLAAYWARMRETAAAIVDAGAPDADAVEKAQEHWATAAR